MKTKSKYEDLVGQHLNQIEILAVIGKNKRNEAIIKCKCFCGKNFECIGYSLKSGNTKSCGCLNDKKRKERVDKFNKDNHTQNDYYIESNVVYMKSKTSDDIIIFDEHNLSKILPYSWSVDNGYAVSRINNKKIKMHRFIKPCTIGMSIDHIKSFNGIPKSLNNLEVNLREVTHQQNMMNQEKRTNNTSGYRGVTFHKASGKWQPQIFVNSKRIYLGLWDTPEKAFEIRQEAEEKYFKEYRPMEG